MRVISMVPSWTETLIHAGVNVVGRTRFCIHPENTVKNIPLVGGTKEWKWEIVQQLNPDLILLDQEENPKFMSEQTQFSWHSTHIQAVSDMPSALLQLSTILKNKDLKSYSQRWAAIQPLQNHTSLPNLPGLLEWGKRPNSPIKNIIYMIWKDPWMCVSQNTFVGSMLGVLGITLPPFSEKYPQIDLEDFSPSDTLVLFSSEPYPFLKKKSEYTTFPYPHAFIDGESFSWFGIRSLQFLESLKA